ncbi:hypothetical protein [Vibrio fluminensis]|uniref:hypothetical protein n=1 Tax=Vibrio fluminensis TaxID=2783614 RepID=UPI0018882E87|nr:hypothetical protein [Vibrio fluminensis]
MLVTKVIRLFDRVQFPLHHAWLKLLSEAIDGSVINKPLLEEANCIASAMGFEYVAVLNSLLEDTPDVFSEFLSLKVCVKKRKAVEGAEFSTNVVLIESKLAKYNTTKTLQEQRIEQQKVKEQKLAQRQIASDKMFADLRAQYDKQFTDFPSLNINSIRRHSKAAYILTNLNKGMITDADYLWLKQKGFENDQVNSMYYLRRAENSKRIWNTTNKPWNLVNALADYRKADKAKTALTLVNKHFPFKFANGNKKLKSALLTTAGGVKRDLNMLEQAIEYGIQAHELTLKDYRPCTLIGACKMLSGDISQGHEWYQKAINRGFESDSYEQEIRSIYMRAKANDRAEIKKLLINDGWCYKWLK